MIEIIGIWKDRSVIQIFNNVLDAIEFRDELDANYAKVIWNKI